MPDNVVFDGLTSIVLDDDGVENLDAQVDLYSAWKRWCVLITGGFNREGLKYDPALRTVAGDPIRPGKALGAHFFITNGWLIRPYLGSYELVVEGNLWSEPGEAIFTTVTGSATVLATVERAADAYQLIITGSGGGADGFTSSDRTTIGETHDALGEFTGSAIVATVPAVITGTLVTEQSDWLEETHDALGEFTGSAIVATVPAVITGTLVTEQAIWLEETYNALGAFTGSAIIATVPAVITGTLTTEENMMLTELWDIQGLATGTPLEVSGVERTVLGLIRQSIEPDTPVTGTVRVTRVDW